MTPTFENILAVYNGAFPNHFVDGQNWYPSVHDLGISLCPHDPHRAWGVIAALSPMTPWPRNVFLAERTFTEGKAYGCLTNNADKANRIYAGEDPLDVLGGMKITNFYLNIANPYADNVTVDRHAHDIAMGEVFGKQPRKMLNSKGGYNELADLYREVADHIGILPSELQAITWCAWREAIGITD